MLSKAEFIDFILNGGGNETAATTQPPDLPDGFDGFETEETQSTPAQTGSSFARRLLEASGFGNPEFVQRSNVIRSSDAVARFLPERVSFWPKTPSRPYQTLLFEADLNHQALLAIPAFRLRRVAHLDMVEDALARLVSEALEGFQRGGEGVTADVRKGSKEETLCAVSVLDERDGQPVRLVCFGTQNKQEGGLETFQITEQTRLWDAQLAREHLGLLYERQFKKLEGQDWQEAFTTTEERKQAAKLLEVCTRASPTEHDLQEGVLDLLDMIAKGFGLRKKPKTERRLQAFALPPDHDIGIDPKERESSFGGKNPFGGVTLRDERSRLLGYIVYPLKSKADATRLRSHLKQNNRFHNVLVVYPDQDQARLELWQGREQLTGMLRQGQGYRDAADVVNLLSRFFVVSKAKVRNPAELAQELAYRAQYLRRLAVKQLAEESLEGPLRQLYNNFKTALVHDLTEDKFADAYAQTITYGLLTARWTGNAQLIANGERLTRQTALKHLPASSPFLKEFFKSVLAVRLDDQRGRLLWLVDDIADLLDRVDVEYVFGAGDPESTIARDPVIHFYEPFLNAYDPKLKKELGVFYTPRPVVSYIVRSVHELLQTEFGLEDGLASTATWREMLSKHTGLKLPPLTDEPNETRSISPDEPFVQILDPATGTATFLVEVIDVIHSTLVAKWTQQKLTPDQQHDAWNEYVPKHLLPRLHAYELMMAPYAIAHMKVGLKLAETGYRFGTEERARIYLTNALEPWVKQLTLIGDVALDHEAAAVNEIKRHKRFTVVIGNPPYSINSCNLQETAVALVEPFRYVDGEKIQERGALKFETILQDDYVKFWGLGIRILETTPSGIISMISNNGFLTNRVLRGVRKTFLNAFDRLTFFDLHGNRSKGEVCPDGSPDDNVFDINQGVGISILRKTGTAPKTGKVELSDLWGNRDSKYRTLGNTSASKTPFQEHLAKPPYYTFALVDGDIEDEYRSFAALDEAMPFNKAGFVSGRDDFAVDIEFEPLEQRIDDFLNPRNAESTVRERYGIKDAGGYVLAKRRQPALAAKLKAKDIIRCVQQRPFDYRFVAYSEAVLTSPQKAAMNQLIAGDNLAFCLSRGAEIIRGWEHIFCTRALVQHHTVSLKEVNYVFPLNVRVEDGSFAFGNGKSANFAAQFLKALAAKLNLSTERTSGLPKGLTPEDIFHYAYAVFHSPGYRSRYAEFLKIDFPRLPLTGNLELFRALARLGGELTALHLLESPKLAQPITEFIANSKKVTKVGWTDNTVWIDAGGKKGANTLGTSGFRGVPEEVWNYHIGGYQVCEKWLKDRNGRTLTDDDIAHYHKIVIALSETISLMREIDEVIGGWPDAFVTSTAGNDE